MGTQLFKHTSGTFLPQPIAWAGPNDGGVRRGDREGTGDNEAAPDQLGYEPAAGDKEDAAGPEEDYYDGMK